MAATPNTIYRFRVYCITDAHYEYVWSDIEPTGCPDNSSHTIDTNSITIVDSVSTQQISIREENIPTGGNFAATTIKLECAPKSVTNITKSFRYPINALSVAFTSGESHRGDMLEMIAGKDTPIGYIVAPVVAKSAWQAQSYNVSDYVYYNGFNYVCAVANSDNPEVNTTAWSQVPTQLYVSSSVIQYSALGIDLAITDGTHLDRLDETIEVDKVNGIVTLAGASANNYSPLSPTYVLRSGYYLHNYWFDEPMLHEIGNKKIGGSYVPANIPVLIEYTNNSSDAKVFVGRVEYIY